ncbi:MAG TPA: hypothetical protein VMK12_06260 [Anaeromyxobacteraceae bacterium]|nr:hypothetical protein [Anaeromyxobacteraceae bacterium]
MHRLLSALYTLEDLIRSLPPERREAAVGLVVERVRRLASVKRGPGSKSDNRQLYLELLTKDR